ncbi:DUF3426 domain-containing protein [Uliginosibacterium paludis]|uniref:DUF3426 domain-containing protein n=1 Tax=Uliginosibacterium paludis TaxID=1615952 RepID=A0ABV2CV61_9RHOO
MLTTRCPHCSTVFRIRPEQLSVRGGRVRCGHCQQAFSALSHLEEMEDEAGLPPNPVPPVSPSVAAPTRAAAPAVAAPVAQPVRLAAPPRPVPDAPVTSVPAAPASVLAPAVQDDPLQITIDALPASFSADGELDFDLSGLEGEGFSADPVPPAEPVEPVISIDRLPKDVSDEGKAAEDGKPLAAEMAAAGEPKYESRIARELGIRAYDPEADQSFGQTVMLEEPLDLTRMDADEPGPGAASLFDEHERQEHQAGRNLVEDRRSGHGKWKWILGCVLLALVALFQLAYVFRTELAREMPNLRPELEEACALLACTVPYPQEATNEKIKIESSEFFADSGGAGRYRLVATIANHVPYPQAWPSLELTITDRFDIAVARRVLAPAEWLPEANRNQPAFEAHSDVTANISLDLDKLSAQGYRLYVFYP